MATTESLITIRALINNKIGIIDVKRNNDDEDILITMGYPTASDDKLKIVYEYMFDCSTKTMKFKDLLSCICNFPEIMIPLSSTNNNSSSSSKYELTFELEKTENINYTEEEYIKLPIKNIPNGSFARLYPKKLN